MEFDSVVLGEMSVAAALSLSDPLVIVGIVTAGLFFCVLLGQIAATLTTRAAVDLARTEANLRWAPFISVPDLDVVANQRRFGRGFGP